MPATPWAEFKGSFPELGVRPGAEAELLPEPPAIPTDPGGTEGPARAGSEVSPSLAVTGIYPAQTPLPFPGAKASLGPASHCTTITVRHPLILPISLWIMQQ